MLRASPKAYVNPTLYSYLAIHLAKICSLDLTTLQQTS